MSVTKAKLKKAKPAPRMEDVIRSRIVGHGDEDPATLHPHPSNFRRHPVHQVEALQGSLKELGWLKTVLVNRVTGNIIDGHARVEEAARQGAKTVPVTFVELSEEEERLALAVLDPITELAERDADALAALLSTVVTEDPALPALLLEMKGKGDQTKTVNPEVISEAFNVLVVCKTEQEQAELLERLAGEGLECRSLIS